MSEHRIIIGLTERVVIKGNNGHWRHIVARVDTGATKSSIDIKLAEELMIGPVVKSKMFRSAHGNQMRPMVLVNIKFCGRKMKKFFSLVDRTHMRYKILIGQNILKKGFLIDPSK